MEALNEILTLNAVAEKLGYKNRRSAIRWCINNGVEILKYHGTNRKYVLLKQFEWVRSQKVVSKLIKKAPELKQQFG
jgi:hypothetical protein